MGACAGTPTTRQGSDLTTKSEDNKLDSKEQYILRLIHADLSSRIPQNSLDIENFLLFFHKNGFWGIRLFHQFDYGQSNLITESQFLTSIGKIFKTDQDKRIKLLFKFFASSSSPNKIRRKASTIAEQQKNNMNVKEKGVNCQDFLRMLYNYPKEDLQQILNDKDFFEAEIKNYLETVNQRHGLNTHFCPERQIVKAMSMVYRIHENSEEEEPSHSRSQIPESMMGKDILRQIKHRSADETTLKLRDGVETIEVKTTNIHLLVKKFARNMYKSLGINPRSGQLSQEQFSQWIKQHRVLYKNYYDGFHNDIWELDPLTRKPQYLSEKGEMEGTAKYLRKKTKVKVYLLLKRSVLVVCDGNKLTETPSEIICLDGMEVARTFEENSGWGIQIGHREGHYPIKKFFFKNEAVLNEWMQILKYYNGGAIQNQYILGRKLGTGKFSIVYEAQNKQTQEVHAVKVIDYQELDIDARKLIEHESSIMKIMSHPLLVQYKNCIQTKTHLYIVTELCPGKDLYEFVMERKHLTEKDAALIIQQIIVGIRYMNSLGLLHRDLKPENIMVDFDPETNKIQTVKIIDFGFANYLSAFKDMAPEDVLAGTPNYIAPQLLRAEPISFKIDNFSIGSILYFMLSGVPPFNTRNLTDIFTRTLNGTYDYKAKPWDEISQSAKELIDGLLHNDPLMRLSLESALKHTWFKEIKKMGSSFKKT